MRIVLVDDEIPQIASAAVSFFPFGIYVQLPNGVDRLISWSHVKEVNSNDREVHQLLKEAGAIP